MTITALPYQPSGSWWKRTKEVLKTAFENVQIRLAERDEGADFYTAIDQLKDQ